MIKITYYYRERVREIKILCISIIIYVITRQVGYYVCHVDLIGSKHVLLIPFI